MPTQILVLSAFEKDPTGENFIGIYLHYGTKDKPMDHEDKLLELNQEYPLEFYQHLEKKILPQLNEALKKTRFTTDMDVDINNHIFIMIKPIDFMRISKRDEEKIRAIINSVLVTINANILKKNSNSALFSPRPHQDNKKTWDDDTENALVIKNSI